MLSIFPLGGQQGTSLEVQMRGKNLGETYAVWVDGGELKARVDRVGEIELKEFDLVKKAWTSQPGYRVSLQVEIDGSADAGTYAIRAVSPQGVSNALPFRVTADPILTETGGPRAGSIRIVPGSWPSTWEDSARPPASTPSTACPSMRSRA